MDPIQALQDKLTKLHAEARAIEAAADAAGRELNEEEIQKLRDLDAAFQATQSQIEMRKRAMDREAVLAAPTARLTQPDMPQNATITAIPQRPAMTITGGQAVSATYANHGFTGGFREYLAAVRYAAMGKSDARLLNAVTTYGSENAGADGGFAVPPQFAQTITQVVQGEGSLVERFNPIMTSSNQVVVPVDETTPWGSTGIFAEWLSDGVAMAARKPVLKERIISLQKVGAMVYVSDELQSDAPAIQSFITRKTAQALAAAVNNAIVQGNGQAKPLGLVNAPGLATVADTGTGTAYTAVDLGSMLSRMPPESINTAFWLMHSTFYATVWGLVLGQMPIYQPNFRETPYGSLLGRPVVLSEHCSDYNTVGDVFLVSPDGYLLAIKSMGVETAASIHFAFDQGLNAFRATMRVGGAPLASATITRKSGSAALSHIICMGVRS